MKLRRRKFLHLAAGLPCCRRCRTSRGRKPGRRGRCASFVSFGCPNNKGNQWATFGGARKRTSVATLKTGH